jgi:hypothetical protein
MSAVSLGSALLFVIVGIGVFACALVLIARILPGRLWVRAVEERDMAAAIVLAAVALALGWIIAAAVH